MSAHHPLFHAVFSRITSTCPHLRKTARTRLSLLVTGILVAGRCVQLDVADALLGLDLTRATSIDTMARRLRRVLNDARLDPAVCYEPALSAIIDWDALRAAHRSVILILDESTAADRVHLLRLALAYRGSALPLVWAAWEQNAAQEPGSYWQAIDTLLARAAALLPPDLPVLLLADRAYDVPPLLDRLTRHGWHWIIRLKTKASTKVLDHHGREGALIDLLARRLCRPGWRCKARLSLFKDAGWRQVSLVGVWAQREDEALVVISDLPVGYDLVAHYRLRFWIEAGFRTDKRGGWDWEHCQVRDISHQAVLLLALAWATLLTLCLGSDRAEEEMAKLGTRRAHRPQPARFSIFRLGRHEVRAALLHPARWHVRWRLSALDAPSWNDQWLGLQRQRYLSQTVRL
jgi:hypothetical protein